MWSWASGNSFPQCSLKIAKSNIPKLSTCRVWDSLSPIIWSKYDIDTRVSHMPTYSDEIRASVTYLITITLINNRKIDTQ